MSPLADLARAFKRLDLEEDHAAFHRNHFCGGAHNGADQRSADVADIDLGPDRDPARLIMAATKTRAAAYLIDKAFAVDRRRVTPPPRHTAAASPSRLSTFGTETMTTTTL